MAKKTIMVVDDEPDILYTVKEVLGREGYDVVLAVNGDDCLKKLSKMKKQPDLDENPYTILMSLSVTHLEEPPFCTRCQTWTT